MDRRDVDNRPAARGFHQRVSKLDKQENGSKVGSHYGVPFLYGRLHQRLGNLDGGIVHKRIERGVKCPRLFENVLRGLGLRDIRLDKASILWKAFAKIGTIHANHPPVV